MRFTLKKAEILRGRKSFSEVISSGISFADGPLRAFVLPVETQEPHVLVGFSVARRIRRAVNRNKARRYLREAFRRNKTLLPNPRAGKKLFLRLVFMYTGEIPEESGKMFATVETSMKRLLQKITRNMGG